jgi:hypothetical protein
MQPDLERVRGERDGILDWIEQLRGSDALLAHRAPCVGEVVGRDGHAVAPARVLPDLEAVDRAVVGKPEALRQSGEDVEVTVQLEQSAKQVRKDVPARLPVGVAGRDCVELERGGKDLFGELDRRRLGHPPREGFAVGTVRLLEIEREVVGQGNP